MSLSVWLERRKRKLLLKSKENPFPNYPENSSKVDLYLLCLKDSERSSRKARSVKLTSSFKELKFFTLRSVKQPFFPWKKDVKLVHLSGILQS